MAREAGDKAYESLTTDAQQREIDKINKQRGRRRNVRAPSQGQHAGNLHVQPHERDAETEYEQDIEASADERAGNR